MSGGDNGCGNRLLTLQMCYVIQIERHSYFRIMLFCLGNVNLLYTYIHAYIHTYMHTYIHTYIQSARLNPAIETVACQQEPILYTYSAKTFLASNLPLYHSSPSHAHWCHCSVHKWLKCQGSMAVD